MGEKKKAIPKGSAKEKSVWLVVLAGYDSHSVLAAFSTRHAAVKYRLTLPLEVHGDRPDVEVVKLNPTGDDLPGVWRVWWKIGATKPEAPDWLSMTPRECRQQFKGHMVGLSTDDKWVIASAVTQAGALQVAERAATRRSKRAKP